MMEILTERLSLTPMTRADFDWFAALRADPQVMRFIGQGVPLTTEQATERMDRLVECWATHDLGMFGIRPRGGGAPIGWAGVQPLDDDIEVGYAFAPETWGKGYATEVSREIIRWAFATRGLEKIVAISYPENQPSRHVMEKLGMNWDGMRTSQGIECVIYSITPSMFAEHEAGSTEPC